MPDVTLTYAEVGNAVATLNDLSKRVLPGMASEGLVARAMRALNPHAEDYNARSTALNARHVMRDKDGHPVKTASGTGEQITDLSKWQEEVAALGKETVTITVKQLFTAADLPKARDTKPGNEDGRASILFGLGPLFDWDTEG